MKLKMMSGFGDKPTILDRDSSFSAVLNGNNAEEIGNLFVGASDLLEVLRGVRDLLEHFRPSFYLKSHYKTMQRVIRNAEKGVKNNDL